MHVKSKVLPVWKVSLYKSVTACHCFKQLSFLSLLLFFLIWSKLIHFLWEGVRSKGDNPSFLLEHSISDDLIHCFFFFTYPWIPFVFFQLKVAQQKSVMAFYILLFFNKIRYINLQLRIICHFTNTHLQYNATPQKCKYYWYAVSNSTCITKSKCDLILFIFFYVEYIGIFSTFCTAYAQLH